MLKAKVGLSSEAEGKLGAPLLLILFKLQKATCIKSLVSRYENEVANKLILDTIEVGLKELINFELRGQYPMLSRLFSHVSHHNLKRIALP